MPVADRKTNDDIPDEPVPIGCRLDLAIFEEIKEYIENIKLYQKEIRDDERKSEKLAESIASAEETLARGENKKQALMRQNKILKTRLESLQKRKESARDPSPPQPSHPPPPYESKTSSDQPTETSSHTCT